MARDQELEPIPVDELAAPATTTQNTVSLRLGSLQSASFPDCERQQALLMLVSTRCYLYCLFGSYFSETRQWRNFDPFYAQKEDAFKNSSTAIYCACHTPCMRTRVFTVWVKKMATSMHELARDKKKLRLDPDKLVVPFREMI
ncbi:hypothetical protein V8E55_009591 [Tylopilus felleus]